MKIEDDAVLALFRVAGWCEICGTYCERREKAESRIISKENTCIGIPIGKL